MEDEFETVIPHMMLLMLIAVNVLQEIEDTLPLSRKQKWPRV